MDALVMKRLRGFLRICFGYLTLITTLVSGFTVTWFFRMVQHPDVYQSHYRGRRSLVASAVLIVLSRLVRAVPLVMAVTYGMAWWTLKKGRPFARRWAIAASSVMVLSSAGMILARLTLWPARHFRGSFLLFQIFFFAAGVLGLIVFAKSPSASIRADGQPARMRGDGTSSFLDLAVSVLAVGGLWGGMIVYLRWGHRQQLPFIRGSVSLTFIALTIVMTVILHEAAHAGVGLAVGMKLRAFVIGPFQWRISDGHWRYLFNPAGFLSFGGSAGLVPTNPDQSRWFEIATIAAGPLINLCASLIAFFLAISAKGQSWEHLWEPLAFFATVNLVTFAVNLVPFRPEALYSDGARIYQLLSRGPWLWLHRARAIAVSSVVTQLRPRDYDLTAILRAEMHFTHGREALMLRLLATSHYLDIGQLSDARTSYADALGIYQASQFSISSDVLAAFVFNSAWLDRDASTARRFWDLFETKKPAHFGVDYWLARTALHWIEGYPREARDAWATGNGLAEQLPDVGAYNFDRHRYRLMEELFETSQTTTPSTE